MVEVEPFFDFLPPLCDLVLLLFLPLLVLVVVLVVPWSVLPVPVCATDNAPPSTSVHAIRNSFFIRSPLKGSFKVLSISNPLQDGKFRAFFRPKHKAGLSICRDFLAAGDYLILRQTPI